MVLEYTIPEIDSKLSFNTLAVWESFCQIGAQGIDIWTGLLQKQKEKGLNLAKIKTEPSSLL
jgi:hypothetical protein